MIENIESFVFKIMCEYLKTPSYQFNTNIEIQYQSSKYMPTDD